MFGAAWSRSISGLQPQAGFRWRLHRRPVATSRTAVLCTMTPIESQPAMLPEMTADLPVEILLVEDNPNDVKLTLHALKRHRLTNRIHVVRDGAEVLEFLFATGAYAHRQGTDSPRVVMLDLKLPRVDGLEVLREIRRNPSTRTLPVVILTSSREAPAITEASAPGRNALTVKTV